MARGWDKSTFTERMLSEPDPIQWYAGQPHPSPNVPTLTPAMPLSELRAAMAGGLVWVDPRPGSLQDNPFNPRAADAYDDDAEFVEFGRSIFENGMPQLPTVWIEIDDEAEAGFTVYLEDGHRRRRAVCTLADDPAREYGYMLVQVVEKSEPAAMLTRAALANNGKPLRALEWADVYLRLEKMGLTQAEIGQRFNIEQGTVSNAIRLTRLPATVRGWINTGALTASHGLQLLKLSKHSERESFAQQAVEEHWSTRTLEDAVRKYIEQQQAEKAPQLMADPGAAPMAGGPAAGNPAPACITCRRSWEALAAAGVDMVSEVCCQQCYDEAIAAGREPVVRDGEPDEPDELSICRECGRTDAQVERDGGRMLEPTLCESCHDRERYNEHTQNPAPAAPETAPPAPETPVDAPTTGDGDSDESEGTQRPGKPSASAARAMNSLTPRAAADLDYLNTLGLGAPDVFELAVRVCDLAEKRSVTWQDLLAQLERESEQAARPATVIELLDRRRELKNKTPDTLFAFRSGEHYSLFQSDAEVAACKLGLELVAGIDGTGEVGTVVIPAKAIDRRIRELARAGHQCCKLAWPEVVG